MWLEMCCNCRKRSSFWIANVACRGVAPHSVAQSMNKTSSNSCVRCPLWGPEPSKSLLEFLHPTRPVLGELTSVSILCEPAIASSNPYAIPLPQGGGGVAASKVQGALPALDIISLLESAGATNSVCSPPPCGGGLGRGVVVMARAASANGYPHPQPLPTRGRGVALSKVQGPHRARGNSFAFRLTEPVIGEAPLHIMTRPTAAE